MRAYVPDYELRAPRDLGDALDALAREPGAWRPFAGGTDLMVLFEAGLLAHKKFLSDKDFHTGYKKTVMRADELVARVRLPRAGGGVTSYYRKVGTRRAQAVSKVCMAATARVEAGRVRAARIALGSVAPTVVRCPRTEELLRDRTIDAHLIRDARASLASEIAPIDDVRSTADYRLRVAQNLLEDFLTGVNA
ncbi:MAG: hypothetical protein LC800_17990 [Acidobacteria bacterium]|nr:hypothetical protein [Acidobacteriota bacterium]